MQTECESPSGGVRRGGGREGASEAAKKVACCLEDQMHPARLVLCRNLGDVRPVSMYTRAGGSVKASLEIKMAPRTIEMAPRTITMDPRTIKRNEDQVHAARLVLRRDLREAEFFIDNLLVRTQIIIEII